MKKKRTTAAELIEANEANPEWHARQEAWRQKLAIRRAETRRNEAPLIAELQANGISVSSVSELVNTSAPYPNAVPILFKHFLRSYPDKTKEFIARALAVKEARYLWPQIVAEYRSTRHGENARTGLAVALGALVTRENIFELIELANDKSLGESRAMFLGALRRSRDPKVKAALWALGSDPQLASFVEQLRTKKSMNQ